jgi:hypothetical protein
MYNFNKEKKRLEPSDTKCQYCEIERSTNMEDNYFVPLFRENDRTNIIVYRSVKYSKIPVGIPRCKSCMYIHQEAAGRSALTAWGIAFGVVVFSIIIWGVGGIISIVAALLIGFLGTHLLQNKFIREKGIFTKMDGAKRNPAVQELVIDGWSFTQPTA